MVLENKLGPSTLFIQTETSIFLLISAVIKKIPLKHIINYWQIKIGQGSS